MEGRSPEMRSLALTPTWSVATVMTIFVVLSLLVERSIYRLSLWLKKTHRNPLFQALEKMKEELMLLGFISLLLTASSRIISNICIDSKFYNGRFSPCTVAEVETESSSEDEDPEKRKNNYTEGTDAIVHLSVRRLLSTLNYHSCKEGFEPFVSHEGLEQLHRFIFVMAITHVSYSCLTMLLAVVKIHTWRKWEDEAHKDRYGCLPDVTKVLTLRRQSTFVKKYTSNTWSQHHLVIWMICFFRQFGGTVVRADYLTLRMGFITNHNLTSRYDFHSYMIRSMEEEFKMIVGVSGTLWGFVIAFMLFNVNGSNLYFWIAIIPITLVLLVGAKLQNIVATLALESVNTNEYYTEPTLKPRDELFWFKKPELLLYLIHFILFQNAFELASFFWFWWQFGYESCFMRNHWLVYVRLVIGFSGQFLCSYSTLPLYALVTQMGTNYKAALIPRRIRETMHGWGKAVRKRRRHRHSMDDTTTIRTETSTICSIEEDDQFLDDIITIDGSNHEPQLMTCTDVTTAVNIEEEEHHFHNETDVVALLHSASVPSSPPLSERSNHQVGIVRSYSMPTWRR
ncbi:MLO-like protein 14 [Zostera marina]|uniref:MLO-like protein n=1 Tax=Zostera marina TaxID=29655 RepID=A0A0K9NZ98_ZOSMR|nr:MLO-like protein 14 [Zostera marina]